MEKDGEGREGREIEEEVNCHAQLKHGRRLAYGRPDFNRFRETFIMTFIRPVNKGQRHSFWYQSISHIRVYNTTLSIVTFALRRTI